MHVDIHVVRSMIKQIYLVNSTTMNLVLFGREDMYRFLRKLDRVSKQRKLLRHSEDIHLTSSDTDLIQWALFSRSQYFHDPRI
jgi:hypothetical protein